MQLLCKLSGNARKCICFGIRKYTKLSTTELTKDLHLQRYSALLSNYGFKPGQISRILDSRHLVFSLKEDDLKSNLLSWLNFDVNEKLFTALAAYPELLTLNPDYLNNRVKELMTLFTKKDINKLLVTSPKVFLDEFTDIYEKVQYIVATMGVEQKSIVKCRVLQFDLHHLKCRHVFMTRAGCYRLKKKAVKCRNAPLDKIFSRNMETFLKLTKLTEEEYLVFLDTYRYEEDLLKEYLEENEEEELLNLFTEADYM